MYTGSLYITSDHGGYQLKKRLVRYIENELEQDIEDLGPYEHDPEDDYPDYVIPLTKKVLETNGRGIVICRNGVGVAMAANKVDDIRCGQGYNIGVAKTMMQHSNTNVISLASDHLSEDHAMAIIKKWLETEFSKAERHMRRLKKIKEIEKK